MPAIHIHKSPGCPSAPHLPADRPRTGSTLARNNSASAGGNPRDAAGGGLGCPGRLPGRWRGAQAPCAGQGPPFPPTERRGTQTPKTLVTSCSLLPAFYDLRISKRNFSFRRSCRCHHLQASLRPLRFSAVTASGRVTGQCPARVAAEPGGSGRGCRLRRVGAATAGGERGAAPHGRTSSPVPAPARGSLGLPAPAHCTAPREIFMVTRMCSVIKTFCY